MSKKRNHSTLNRDAAFVYGGYFLRYLSLVVLIPYYGRVLGPAAYGKVLAAMSLMSIVWLVVNYGFSITGARELASVRDVVDRGRIYGRQIVARFMLVPVGILVGAVGTVMSPVLVSDWRYGVLATTLGLVEAFNLGWFFQGISQFRTSMAIEAMSYPLNLILVLLLVRNATDGVFVMFSLLTSSVFCIAFSYCIAARTIRILPQGFADGWSEIKSSGVIFIQTVNSILMTSGATYALSVFSTPEQVSYFGTADRFIALGLSLLGPAGQILMPTISNIYLDDRPRAIELVRKGLLWESGFGLIVLLVGLLLSPFLIPLILGEKFDGSIRVLQILACMVPFAAFSHALGLYLFVPLRREKLLIIAISVGSLVNLGLAVFAAQAWGSVGMAASRVAGEVVVAVVLAVIALRIGFGTLLLQPDSDRDLGDGAVPGSDAGPDHRPGGICTGNGKEPVTGDQVSS
ncbi:MAG TPA: oligosaccharide flippase family protein [Patescibacteria group bacterium]|nr:oligosaccharide flippase family protein [Patescibacteria group bacterium]